MSVTLLLSSFLLELSSYSYSSVSPQGYSLLFDAYFNRHRGNDRKHC
jgi:hypothetical protein